MTDRELLWSATSPSFRSRGRAARGLLLRAGTSATSAAALREGEINRDRLQCHAATSRSRCARGRLRRGTAGDQGRRRNRTTARDPPPARLKERTVNTREGVDDAFEELFETGRPIEARPVEALEGWGVDLDDHAGRRIIRQFAAVSATIGGVLRGEAA